MSRTRGSGPRQSQFLVSSALLGMEGNRGKASAKASEVCGVKKSGGSETSDVPWRSGEQMSARGALGENENQGACDPKGGREHDGRWTTERRAPSL
jgi:hypothetical protein